MVRLVPIAVVLLAGCATAADQVVVPDGEATRVSDAMLAAAPERMVELVDATGLMLSANGDCPKIDVLPQLELWAGTEDGLPLDSDDGTREIWTGGCTTADGATVEGSLERRTLGDASWLSADGYTVRRDGEVEVYLDGAIEVFSDGDLLLIEASASLCGTDGLDCQDGPLSVDLAWSLFPASSYPAAYDATVRGVVGDQDDAAIGIQGAWTVDGAVCGTEPVAGTFALRTTDRHILELDGDDVCDACAGWWLHGAAVGPYCGLSL